MNRRQSIVRPLRTVAALFALLAAGAPARLLAQIAGPNVNMVSGTQWPGGDPFLQRQNEPSLDVSTRFPLHLLAGANDYRTVDLPFADELPSEGNAGDAWLGVFKSFDGGRTWRSVLLPGYPQDRSADGLASPLKGFAAAADPTVRAGANGVFLYSGIAFNRGNNAPGVLFAARFIDNNNKEYSDPALGRDPIKYVGTAVVDTGNAGQFLDKPTLAVDVPRPGSAPCTFTTPKDGGGTLTQTFPGGKAYLAYSVFVGGNNNLHTKLLVASSSDCGATWGNPVKVTEGSHINQGAALAIDPATGAVTVAWRRFASGKDPNGILVSRSSDGGKKWSNEVSVVSLPSYNAASPQAATLFDQGTTSGSFRTNAYPALAADGSGRLYLAWSMRVGPNGDARVVVSTSTNGTAWSAPVPVDNGLVVDDTNTPFAGLTGRGHQLMPALRFAAGKLMVLYYDLRLDHTVGLFSPIAPAPNGFGLFFSEARQPAGEPLTDPRVFTPFITDTGLTLRRHTLDVRVAQASPAASPAFTSARVSRYVFGSRPGQRTIEQLQINPPNLPMFKLGTAPFMGDYIDIAGPPPFVPKPDGSWAYNTAPASDAVFQAAWTDNRDVRPPKDGNWANYTPVGSTGGPSVFDPTQKQPPCAVGQTGMRNQNIYTAKVSQGLIVSTPSNAKPLTTLFPRIFATVVQNATEFTKSYRLTIANQPPGGRASFLRDGATLTTVDVALAPRSSASRPVFVTSSVKNAPVTVSVAEISAPSGSLVSGGLTGAVVFNPDVSNPDVSNPDVSNPDVSNPDVSNVEVYTPDVSNPDVSNPDVSNPDVSNPDVSNPDVSNPDVSNPDVSNIGPATPDVSNPDVSNPDVSNPDVSNADVSNTGLTDANYVITNNGNTAATYRIRLIGNPPASAKLQLILSKTYKTPVAVGCTLTEQPQNTLVANVTRPVFTTDLTALADPGTQNPDVSNATMSLAPGETGLITLRGTLAKGPAGIQQMKNLVSQTTPVVVPHAPPSNAPPNTPPIVVAPLFIATPSLPDGTVGQAYSQSVAAIGGKPDYHFTVQEGSLPAGLTLSDAGLITGSPLGPAGSTTFTVQVADSSAPTARVATRPLAINVTASGVVIPPVVSYGGATISGVSLNNGGNVLTLPGGGSFTLSHAYTIVNPPGCPTCIDQIEVGLATSVPACSTGNLIPTTPQSGTGSATLTAPSTPGVYYIGVGVAEDYSCFGVNDGVPFWWGGAPGPSRYIGAVIVPNPAVPDQTNLAASGTSYGCGGSGGSLFQSFTPTGTSLAAVELLFRAGGSFTSAVQTTANVRSGSPGGTILGNSTVTVQPVSVGGTADVTFSFAAQPPALVPGQTYVIEWVLPGSDAVLTWLGTSGAYSGGTAFSCGGAAFAEDFAFATYVYP